MSHNISWTNFMNNVANGSMQNNSVNNGTVNGANMHNGTVSGAELKNAVEQLKSMLVGDIFTGEIVGFDQNEIILKLGSGQNLKAGLIGLDLMTNYSKGDMVTFIVENKTDSRIAIKPLEGTAQEYVFANKALEASNLATTKEHLQMVKGLIDLNMPIDKNTLSDVSRLLSKFPDASMDTILRLYKLDIPVTQENINQFNAYKAYEHDITGTIKNLSEDFSQLLNSLIGKGDMENAASITKDFIDLFTLGSLSDDAAGGESITKLSTDMQNLLNRILKDFGLNRLESAKQDDAESIMQLIKNSSCTNSEKLSLIGELVKKEIIPQETLLKMASSEEFGKIFEGVLKNNMFIKPEDVAEKKAVKEFYSRLLDLVNKGSEILQKTGQADSAMAKGMNAVSNNLEFMNELNQQMAFMQIPIKLQEGEARGDLYVYANKKSLAGKNDELTALLHLDMEHLGPMDVYVKMTGGINVSTNFCLESEEMLDFIYEHIDILTKRLNEKGYNFTPTMTIREDGNDGKVDFVKEFMDVTSPVIPVSRYMFDIKA